jgi:hypothetical protein
VIASLLWRLLGVLAATVVGGLAAGAFVNWATSRKLPQWMTRLCRLVGAAGLGFLAALGLLGQGGGFGFGLGGTGAGSGTGSNDTSAALLQPQAKEKKEPAPETPPISLSEEIRVEVLGDPALRRMQGDRFDASRCYRVEADGSPRLLTLSEAKEMIRLRHQGSPPLRKVVLTLYNDSPANDVPRVSDLKRWTEEELPPRGNEPVVVDVEQRGQNASTK